MACPPVYDIQGAGIEPGDFIAYAALWSRSAILKVGLVREVKDGKIKATTAWKNWQGEWAIQGKGKATTLAFPDRVVVLYATSVPSELQKLLEEASV